MPKRGRASDVGIPIFPPAFVRNASRFTESTGHQMGPRGRKLPHFPHALRARIDLGSARPCRSNIPPYASGTVSFLSNPKRTKERLSRNAFPSGDTSAVWAILRFDSKIPCVEFSENECVKEIAPQCPYTVDRCWSSSPFRTMIGERVAAASGSATGTPAGPCIGMVADRSI